jgi:hypothetical protein
VPGRRRKKSNASGYVVILVLVIVAGAKVVEWVQAHPEVWAVPIGLGALWVVYQLSQLWARLAPVRVPHRVSQAAAPALSMTAIDVMDGVAFERLMESLFTHMGYRVRMTKLVGDFGADLVLSGADEQIVVQVKRWKSRLGLGPVQEAVAARGHYRCHRAVVVTNSDFTPGAVALAISNDVYLWDRKRLSEELQRAGYLPGAPGNHGRTFDLPWGGPRRQPANHRPGSPPRQNPPQSPRNPPPRTPQPQPRTQPPPPKTPPPPPRTPSAKPFEDLYSLLGVPPDATPEELNKAWKRQMQFWHPDKAKNPNSLRRSQALNQAYERLSDPTKRADYDRLWRRHNTSP